MLLRKIIKKKKQTLESDGKKAQRNMFFFSEDFYFSFA